VGTTLTLNAAPTGGSNLDQQVVLTATLNPYTAQGHGTDGQTITFLSNGSSIGTGTLSGGAASLNVTNLAAGPDSLSASYTTDGNFSTATATVVPYMVASATTPTITFSIPEKHAADAPFQATATSNSAAAITYSLVSGPATVSVNGLVTLNGTAGAVSVEASQAASGSYGPGSATATFTVAAGSVWAVNAGGSASVFDLAGNAFSSTALTGAGLGTASGSGTLAFDALANAWVRARAE
jgi:hypothetical protein